MSRIIRFEWAILMVIGVAFWFPSPLRDQWLWLLTLLPIMLLVRFVVAGHIWTRSPLDVLLGAFVALGALNLLVAPYTRGFIMLGRPLFGIALFSVIVEQARNQGKLTSLLWITVGLGGALGLIALTMSQWTTKSDQLLPLINFVPAVRGVPGMESGFNVNEIAGSLSWFVPLLAALALYPRKRFLPVAAFAVAFLALFFGQSRLAIFGTLFGLIVIIVTLIKNPRKRLIAWIVLTVICLTEIAVISNVFLPVKRTASLSRDDSSLTLRVGIWQSAASIILDYPVTGVGLSWFRYSPVREMYPAPGYENRILPHAHNEWLQIGADMGIPGMVVFTGFYIVAGYMLVYGYRHGDATAQLVTAGVAAGLLAHAVFGLGDAIPFWDRMSFFFWYLLGLAAAQYGVVRRQVDSLSLTPD